MQDHEFTFVIDFAEDFEDGLGRISWSGEDLQHAQAAAGVAPDTVGESAAGVDGDAKWLGSAGHGVEFGELG